MARKSLLLPLTLDSGPHTHSPHSSQCLCSHSTSPLPQRQTPHRPRPARRRRHTLTKPRSPLLLNVPRSSKARTNLLRPGKPRTTAAQPPLPDLRRKDVELWPILQLHSKSRELADQGAGREGGRSGGDRRREQCRVSDAVVCAGCRGRGYEFREL